MTDLDATTQRSGINIRGNINRGIIDSNFGPDATINFGDYYYSYSAILLQQELYLVPSDRHPEIVAPSQTDSLLESLERTHLIVLSAPAHWRQSYVAEYLAYRIRQRATATADDQGLIYSLTSEASGNAFLDALRDKTNKLKSAVILASSTLPEKYDSGLIHELAEHAREREAYIILTTEQNLGQWTQALEPGMTACFFDLEQVSPYSRADMANWLLNSPDLQSTMEMLGVERTSLDGNTIIPGLDSRLEEIANALGSPGSIQQFLNGLRSLDAETETTAQHLRSIFDDIISQKHWTAERRIEGWFDELNSSEKYLVLAISLLDGLRQETFWAIYEQLTQLAWREREMQLVMSDYHHIAIKLDQFVSATGDQVRFHNAEERRKLVAYALDGYRRSLVQALPVLADIVSGANQPVTTSTGALAGRLRILDIFGSELEPTGENRQRQERLRNSIANSIAQIAQREPATTQHLLLAWASGVGDDSSENINTRLRIAVTITLVQMLTIEAPQAKENAPWHEQHTAFALLNEWYTRYYPGNSTAAYNQSAQLTEERHRNIRGTMALALCHIGRHMSEADFGSLDDNWQLLQAPPPYQSESGDINCAWQMLIALAWDQDSHVRASIIEGLPVLMQRHRRHAEALVNLLASDWRPAVRIDMAVLLDALYSQAPANIYFIDYLLDEVEPLTGRELPTNNHYLRREVAGLSQDYPLHLWTASLAMFYIANRDEAAFQSYLQTVLSQKGPHLLAFEDVLRFVIRDDDLRKLFQNTALLYVFMDSTVTGSTGKNGPSQASLCLEELLQNSIGQPAIQRNMDWFRSYIGALVRGRWHRPNPTPAVLTHLLDRVTIREHGVEALIRHYVNLSANSGADNERLRRRLQRTLDAQTGNRPPPLIRV